MSKITLTQGSARFEVDLDRGANVSRWDLDSRPVFFIDEDSYRQASVKYKGGNPIMFPIFSTLCVDGGEELRYRGKRIELKQHGIARLSTDWIVVEQTQQEVTMSLASCPKTLAIFPFEFKFMVTYSLEDRALAIRQKVENTGDDDLPFVAGFHPYFYVSDPANCEVVGIPAGAKHDVRLNTGETDLGAKFKSLPLGKQEVNHHFRPLRNTYRLRDRLLSRDIILKVSKEYPCLTVWSNPGEPYVCVEPNSGRRGAFETREDLVRLKPGSTWEGNMRFEVA